MLERETRDYEVRVFPGPEDQLLAIVRDLTGGRRSQPPPEPHPREIADCMVQGLIVLRLDDVETPSSLKILTANNAAARHARVSSDHLDGRTVTGDFPHLAPLGSPDAFAQVVRGGVPKYLGEIYCEGHGRAPEGFCTAHAFPLSRDSIGITFEHLTGPRRTEQELAARPRNTIGECLGV